MEEVKETQPKKKGSAKTKKQKDTEETIVENNEIVNDAAPVEEAPNPEPTTEEAQEPTVEEAPKPEPTAEEAQKPESTAEEAPKPEPKETVAKPEPVKPVEQPKDDSKPTTAKKSVPTIAELRKMRKFNESVFKFSDGFACTATSQRTANAKHNAWLAGE